MSISSPEDSVDMAQLVRHVLTIDNMCAPDCIIWVRQQLVALGLVVDRVQVGEAEVATTHSAGPNLDAIRQALEVGGYRLINASTTVG